MEKVKKKKEGGRRDYTFCVVDIVNLFIAVIIPWHLLGKKSAKPHVIMQDFCTTFRVCQGHMEL